MYVPPPSRLLFAFLHQISWGNPYIKILDLANLFVAYAPMKKKIKKFSFTPLLEHCEIWVWKPAMG